MLKVRNQVKHTIFVFIEPLCIIINLCKHSIGVQSISADPLPYKALTKLQITEHLLEAESSTSILLENRVKMDSRRAGVVFSPPRVHFLSIFPPLQGVPNISRGELDRLETVDLAE